MLLDVRTYTCRPGTIKKHLELYEEKGKPTQTKPPRQPSSGRTCVTGSR